MMTMVPQASIPVIDISPLLRQIILGAEAEATDCSAAISAISEAVHSHGMFAITGHGIPAEVMSSALAASRASLDRDGMAEREHWEELEQQASMRLPGEFKNFIPAGGENLGRLYKAHAPAEWVAKFSVFPPSWDTDEMVPVRQRNIWPATASGEALKEALEAYYGYVQHVSETLHHALSQSLGKSPRFIRDMLAPYGYGCFRALRYHREEDSELSAPALAAHRDLGTTTLLLSDSPGLQFQPRGSDEWIEVVVPRDALVVNLGEFFEIWTGGAWQATLHRVSATYRQGGRTSLAFFSNQAIPLPREGGIPMSRTVAPLDDMLTGSRNPGDRHAWKGVATQIATDARQSVQWPAFLFERVASMMQGNKCEGNEVQCTRPERGGA